MDDSLDAWLSIQGFYKKPSEDAMYSHLLFKGGHVYLPKTHEETFIKKYAYDMSLNRKLYFIETRPEIFKYMIDYDIADDHFWSYDEILSLSMETVKIVNEFYPTSQFSSIVCAANKEKVKGSEIHTGIHLHWPKLYVIAEVALMLRKAILQKLELSRPLKTTSQKSWVTMLDDCIYKKNGFRMVGSDKYDKVLKQSENRIYEPIAVIGYNHANDPNDPNVDVITTLKKHLERLKKNPVDLIKETSTRYVPESFILSNSQGMMPTLPTWYQNDMTIIKKTSNKSSKSSITTAINDPNSILKWVLFLIHKHMPVYKQYPNLIREILRYPSIEKNIVGNILIITNTKYCTNLDREHGSCGIYFHISPRGLSQKCLCPCENLKGRKHGLCKNYRSEIFSLPFDIKILLDFYKPYSETDFSDPFGEKIKPITDELLKEYPDDDNNNEIEKDPKDPKDIDTETKPLSKEKKKKINNQRPNYQGMFEPDTLQKKIKDQEIACGLLLKRLGELEKKN